MTPSAPLGLYVHVPFCEAKCTCCHFAIDPRRPDDARQERYLGAVLREMGESESGRADTLYFGGGTPSLMTAQRLGRIAQAARDRFSLAETAEITVEANPRDLDEAGYEALRDLLHEAPRPRPREGMGPPTGRRDPSGPGGDGGRLPSSHRPGNAPLERGLPDLRLREGG